MKSVLTTWVLLFGLLLQSVVWALPAQRAGQADRLAHEVAHAIDHGHHQHLDPHGALGHDLDPTLMMDDAPSGDDHGPHHSHASEGVQFQGLPVAAALPVPTLPRSAPRAWTPVQPPSADPDSWLRPPRSLI
ncbi:MAG: hypothetical protein KJ677_02335 [Gammaproteobacteria bacterium]|nr:hypothetical protein [Gammaproteobacteria bacterium]